MKIGDLVKFRMAFGTADDWSPPTLVIEKFSGSLYSEDLRDWHPDIDYIYVGLCRGTRCMIDVKRYEVVVINES